MPGLVCADGGVCDVQQGVHQPGKYPTSPPFSLLLTLQSSQYFLWYLWLLPPILPRLNLSRTRGLALLAVWVLAQALWLSQAARLELAGQAVYVEVWAAGIVFFGANCWVLGQVLGAWRVEGVRE